MLGLRCFAQPFSSCSKQGLVFVAVLGLLGGTVSQCGGFSCCRGHTPGARASVGAARTQQLWHTGSVALRHVGSSQTRDRTHVPCLGKWIPIHSTTQEVQQRGYFPHFHFHMHFRVQSMSRSWRYLYFPCRVSDKTFPPKTQKKGVIKLLCYNVIILCYNKL